MIIKGGKTMENEKLNDLITYLLAESPELNSLTIPTNELEQFRLYRSLVNIRPAGKTSDEYLQIEDAFLQEMTQRKGTGTGQKSACGLSEYIHYALYRF